MKVVLATDGTKYGDAAIEMVGRLALSSGDSVAIISVVDMALPLPIDIYGGYLPDTAELEEAARENTGKILAAAKERLETHFRDRGVSVSTVLEFGSPESRIVEAAEEGGADLIVLGSHGYKQWERLLLGSVSNSVAHHAPCSVLIVRSRDA